MRHSAVLTTLVLTAATLAVATPASAMEPRGSQVEAAKGKLSCVAGVVGVDAKRRVRYDTVRNGKVTDSTRSGGKLPFKVTAWGLFDSTESQLRLDAVTTSGVPRQVRITFSKAGRITGLGSVKFAQTGFEPKLFAEGYGYHAYAVQGGKLRRYSLQRYRNGDLKYAGKVTVGSGYGDLTSLQVTSFATIKGALKEILYATTETGALLQIQVPDKKPGNPKVRTLATTGYAGVTEMSWSLCDDAVDHVVLVTIDPVAGTATWTTIKHAYGKARTTLRGEVKGGRGWDFSAAY